MSIPEDNDVGTPESRRWESKILDTSRKATTIADMIAKKTGATQVDIQQIRAATIGSVAANAAASGISI